MFPSVKTGLQFKSRFWEQEGLWGGKAVTDLPIRLTYYPNHGIGSGDRSGFRQLHLGG